MFKPIKQRKPELNDFLYSVGDPQILKNFKFVHPDNKYSYEESSLYNLGYVPNYIEWWYDVPISSLQDLVNLVPEGTDLNKVQLSIHRDRQINHVTISLTSDKLRTTEDQELEYNKALKNFEEKEISYKKELLEYEEWRIFQQIQKLELMLSRLKSKINEKI